MVVALESSMGQMGSESLRLSTAKAGTVRVQILHSLGTRAPPNGLQTTEDSPLGVSINESENPEHIVTSVNSKCIFWCIIQDDIFMGSLAGIPVFKCLNERRRNCWFIS